MEFYKSASDLQRCPHSVSIPNGMEFYERNFSEQRHQVSVSIPNGMEFYDGVRDGIDQFIRFQFPTGWNSTLVKTCPNFNIHCFNSQRDGILQAKGFEVTQFSMFQFPTGWNSTSIRGHLPHFGYVSIPNGMEFYA